MINDNEKFLSLDVVGADKFVLELSDVLNALGLEGLEPDVEGLLLGEQGLHAREVAPELVRPVYFFLTTFRI